MRQCNAERKDSENVLFDLYVTCLKLVIFCFFDGFLFKALDGISAVRSYFDRKHTPFENGVDAETECVVSTFCSLKFSDCWHISHEVDRACPEKKTSV